MVRWPDLPFGPELQTELIDALARFGYAPGAVQRVLDVPARDLGAAVEDLVEGGGRNDVLVVHILSHGVVDEHTKKLRVVGGDGRHVGRTDVERWLTEVEGRRDSEDRKDAPLVLFLLDFCYAGAIARLDWQTQVPDEQRRAWWIAATGVDAPAYDGRFTRAVSTVLRGIARGRLDAARGLAYVPLSLVAQEIRRQVRAFGEGHYQQVVTGTPVDLASDVEWPFFPNPCYDADEAGRLARRGSVDAALRPFLDNVDELLGWRHFISRMTGTGPEMELGRALLFRGRVAELERLAPWLDGSGPAGLAVVTGSPGAGKSALLGVLLSAAHPVLADITGIAGAGVRGDLPGRNESLAAVHARQRSLDEIVASLARQLGLIEPADALNTERLLESVTGLAAAPVLVVDAVDEALTPTALVEELLLPLATARRGDGTAACRVLVGARPWSEFASLLAAAASSGLLVDLDAVPRNTLRKDLRTYIDDLLRQGPYGRSTMRGSRQAIAETVADVLSRPWDVDDTARWGEFLVANLFAVHLHNQPPIGDPGEAAAVAATVPRALPDLLELDLMTRMRDFAWLRPVLTAVAFAHGSGMPRRVLRAVAGAFRPPELSSDTPTDNEVAEVLDATSFYVRQDVDVDGTVLYRLFHQGLADYLRTASIERAVDAANQVFNHLRAYVGSTDRGIGQWSTAEPYLLRHAADHAIDAGRLDELLIDPEFLVYGDPAALGRTLHLGRSATARRYAAVYRTSQAALARADAGDRRQILAVDAARHGIPELLEQLTSPDDAVPPEFQPRWVTAGEIATPLRHVLVGHKGHVLSLTCGRLDGRSVAISGGLDRTVRIWDVVTGAQLGVLDLGRTRRATSVAYGEFDGRPVVLVAGGLTAHLFDLSSNEELYSRQAEDLLEAAAWGDYQGVPVMLVGARRGTVWVDTPGGTPMPLDAHPGSRVTDLAISGYSPYHIAVTCGEDSAVRLFALDDGRLLGQLDGATAYGVAVAMVDDEFVVVTADREQGRVWKPYADEVRVAYQGHRSYRSAVATGVVDGRPIAVAASHDRSAHMWDLASGETLQVLPGHSDTVSSVAIAEDDDDPAVLTGAEDGTIRVWDASPSSGLRGDGHHSDVSAVASCLVEGRPAVVSGSEDGTARLWDAATGTMLGTLAGHRRVYSVATGTLHGESLAVTGGNDGMAQLWHLTSGEVVCRYQGPNVGLRSVADIGAGTQVRGVAWSELYGRPVVVTAAIDGAARVWDALSGTLVVTYGEHMGPLLAVTTVELAGESMAITADQDGIVRIWRLAAARTHGILDHGDASVSSLAVARIDGNPVVLTGTSDGVRLWDPTDCTMIAVLSRDRNIQAVSCGAVDGTPVAVAGGTTGIVRVWDLDTRRPTATYRIPTSVRGVAVTSSGEIAIGFGSEVAVLERNPR